MTNLNEKLKTDVDLPRDETPCNEYACEGLRLWLNNKPQQAEAHFRARINDTPILAGYAFILCMNGIISYEMDKIEEAQKTLKELEKRCLAIDVCSKMYHSMYETSGMSSNWLSNVRQKIFGSILNIEASEERNKNAKPTIQLIEEQIILADTYLSMAILTFLMHDIPGLMKGGWLLRKSWKIYQKTYLQLYDLFTNGTLECDEKLLPKPSNYSKKLRCSNSMTYFNTKSPTVAHNSSMDKKALEFAGAITILDTNTLQNKIANLNCAPDTPAFKQNLRLNLKSPELHIQQLPLTCPALGSNAHENTRFDSIDRRDVQRLMGAVSFGYGLFQLVSSLLPNKILKVISIFGFQGNRDIGMACLKFARSSIDMRSALATLVLLWFYSFGTQLFQHEEGYSKDNIDMATKLLDESEQEFSDSAIFLFFRGRLHRIKSNIQNSIEAFHKSYNHATQRELKLLCLHEIAWCRLIQLDFSKAAKHFNELREFSVFSKAFYTYMTAICQGACENYSNLVYFREEIVNLLRKSENYKQNEIIRFIQHRVSRLPYKDDEHQNKFYWRLLCYEMLYFWNALCNVQNDQLQMIVTECTSEISITTTSDTSSCDGTLATEPMIGLRDLLLGVTYSILKQYPDAARALNTTIQKRESIFDEAVHILAFAHYELATVILQLNQNNPQKTHEAKQLLKIAQKFQNYDFENRLNVQIQQELKKF